MRLLILIPLIFVSVKAFANDIKLGAMARMEMNRSMVFDANNQGQVQFSKNPSLAIGPYLSYGIGKRFFLDCNVIFSTNSFDVNYKKEDAIFNSAKLRMAEIDFRMNHFIFQNRNLSGLYLSIGIQNSIRRWGEENYINDIIPNTYWPNSRLIYSFGMGYNINTIKHSIRFLLGSNYNPYKEIIYDVNWNQHHFSVIYTFNKKIKGRSKMQSSCPNQF